MLMPQFDIRGADIRERVEVLVLQGLRQKDGHGIGFFPCGAPGAPDANLAGVLPPMALHNQGQALVGQEFKDQGVPEK